MFNVPHNVRMLPESLETCDVNSKIFHCVMFTSDVTFEKYRMLMTSDLFMVRNFMGYPFDRQNPDAYAKTHMLNFVMFDKLGNMQCAKGLNPNKEEIYSNFMMSPWAAGFRLYDSNVDMYFHQTMTNKTTIVRPGLRMTFEHEKHADDLLRALQNHMKTEKRFEDEKFGDFLKYKEGLLHIINDYQDKTYLLVCRKVLEVAENCNPIVKDISI